MAIEQLSTAVLSDFKHFKTVGHKDAAAGHPHQVFTDENHQKWYDAGRKQYETMQTQLAEIARLEDKSTETLLALYVSRMYQRTVKEERPAAGVRGMLLMSPLHKLVFRVPKHTHEEKQAFVAARKAADLPIHGKVDPEHDEMFDFTDYEIRHYDMDITIDEEHASLYESVSGDTYIDYDSATLGYKRVSAPKDVTP